MKRLALGLALVLSVGLGAPALAGGPPTDPVITTGSPSTDPVWPWAYDPGAVETAGALLVGTYVGEVGKRRYIPAFQYQLLYSDPMGGFSCTAYSAAMAVDKATYGGTRVTGREIRALSGVYSYTGMTLADARRATDQLHVSVIQSSGTWADVMTALRANRGVVLQGVYSQVPVNLRGQAAFTGRHAIYLDYLHSSGNYIYVMDPLAKWGARWWPVSVLRAFSEKLGRETGIYPLVYYSYTRTVRLVR